MIYLKKNLKLQEIFGLQIYIYKDYMYILAVPAASLALKSYLKVFITLYSGHSVSGFWQKCFLSHEQLQIAGSYRIKNRLAILSK